MLVNLASGRGYDLKYGFVTGVSLLFLDIDCPRREPPGNIPISILPFKVVQAGEYKTIEPARVMTPNPAFP